MRTPSETYIEMEEADERKPVEIYDFWRNDESENWYYTDGDVSLVFGGNTYISVTLKRGLAKYDSQLEVTTMEVTAQYAETPVIEFIANNPIDTVWIQISKLHRDQDPLEASVVFVGQVKGVSFKGVQATASCVGFEHFLKMSVPVFRYQLTCNHSVFDANCGLAKAGYKTTTNVTVSADGRTLTSADFGSEADGYFSFGRVEFNTTYRTIVKHVGNDITLTYSFNTLVTGNSVDAYPGCDGAIGTCYDKYSNIDSYFGFPYIPIENPATRIP